MVRDRRRRALPLVAAWAAVAVAAVAVASWGVALVGRSVTDDRPAPLAASQVEDRLAQAASSSTSSTSTPDGQATTTTAGPDGATTTTTTTVGTTATTTTLAPTATTSAPPPTTSAPAPPAVGETRTYTLVGGTASLRFEPTGVTVVFANPSPGFDVEIEPEHVNGVKVEFESETHKSRLDGWWDGGPQDAIEERADDD